MGLCIKDQLLERTRVLCIRVKRIRCGDGGENLSGEGQHKPATSNKQPTDDGSGHNHPEEKYADTCDEVMGCSSECCKADCDGPNQPKSTQVLAATILTNTVCKQCGSANTPGSVFVRQAINVFVTTA